MAGEPPHLDGGMGAPQHLPARAPIRRQIVVWENGVPMVSQDQIFTKAQVSELAMAAASQPYVDPNDELAIEMGLPPSEFYGMTNLEVMLIKQARLAAQTGAPDVVEKILDRLIGRPKQSVEKHEIIETYESALKRIAQEEERKKAIPVEAVQSSDEEPIENIF